MLSTSYEFRHKIAQNSKVLLKATLALADGTTVQLAGDDFMMGTASFSEGVSSDGSFDIGAAIMGTFSVQLNNGDRRFDAYDFTESVISPSIGVELDSGGVEWLARGRYTVDQPKAYGGTISITALDNMHLLEKPYSAVGTAYPASLQSIVRDACAHCDVVQLDASFPNDDYVVSAEPDDKALTCRDVIAYAAQAAGCFARCDAQGRLVIDWYDTSAFEGEDWLDGDRFDDDTPYSSGDTADGGNFDDYSSGDDVDGGSFERGSIAVIHAISSSTIVTDDVVVTGVRVTASDEKKTDGSMGRDGEASLYGSEGYVLSIEGNPLVQYGRAAQVAAQVGPRVVGMRFRPFDLSAVGDPAVEAGDPAIVVDNLQNQYPAYLTSLTYKVNSYEAFSCSAETPGRNTATSYSEATKAIVQMRNAVRAETTARELAVAELGRELAESSGLYMTAEQQPDGSTIYYMHDKSMLAESQIVWKMTADAFGVSTDGGTTYPYGLDATGLAILQRISAVEIDTDFLLAGKKVYIGKVAEGQYNTVIAPNYMSVRENTTERMAITTSTYTERVGLTSEYVDVVYSTIKMPNLRFISSSNNLTRMYNANGFSMVAYDCDATEYDEYNGSFRTQCGLTWLDMKWGDAPMFYIGESTTMEQTGQRNWCVGVKAGSSAYLYFKKDDKFNAGAEFTLKASKIYMSAGLASLYTSHVNNYQAIRMQYSASSSSYAVIVDSNGVTLSGAKVTVDSSYLYLQDSTNVVVGTSIGYSGTVSNPSSITVKHGIVTNVR
jgi:hypothetical protein